ncbi:SCO4402 family protein [Hymenobacter perfusus]|uniref:Colicin D immunity protein domain-containing protein n=1 Tax=Hymenobacter perfusus TaxID=1236770 RepID=A0A3R9NVC5_9BACT|nr:hypothetical protein [Hymenobacter perfusus]RSK38432.1 hypothetical protein EI293_21680 [Hymenobacter perfusus]
MMEDASWTTRVVAAIKDVADTSFQQRAWLGAGPEMSSFVETYCTLYDDNNFDGFLAQPAWEETGLNDAVRQEMVRLDQLFQAYQEPGSDAEILVDPKWQEVTQQAQQVLRTISAEATTAG